MPTNRLVSPSPLSKGAEGRGEESLQLCKEIWTAGASRTRHRFSHARGTSTPQTPPAILPRRRVRLAGAVQKLAPARDPQTTRCGHGRMARIKSVRFVAGSGRRASSRFVTPSCCHVVHKPVDGSSRLVCTTLVDLLSGIKGDPANSPDAAWHAAERRSRWDLADPTDTRAGLRRNPKQPPARDA